MTLSPTKCADGTERSFLAASDPVAGSDLAADRGFSSGFRRLNLAQGEDPKSMVRAALGLPAGATREEVMVKIAELFAEGPPAETGGANMSRGNSNLARESLEARAALARLGRTDVTNVHVSGGRVLGRDRNGCEVEV